MISVTISFGAAADTDGLGATKKRIKLTHWQGTAAETTTTTTTTTRSIKDLHRVKTGHL